MVRTKKTQNTSQWVKKDGRVMLSRVHENTSQGVKRDDRVMLNRVLGNPQNISQGVKKSKIINYILSM